MEIQSVTSNVIGQDQSFSSKQQVRGLSHDSNTTVLHPLIFNMVHTPNLPFMFLALVETYAFFGLVRKLEGYWMMLVLGCFGCNTGCLLFRKTTIENERYLWSMSGSTLELTHNHGAEMDENFKVPTTPGWFKGLIYIYIYTYIAVKMERMGIWSLVQDGLAFAYVCTSICTHSMYKLGPDKAM